MSIINAQDWSHDQVADWIQGLESSLTIYGQHFVSCNVNGSRLLSCMAGDLALFGVHRVGDQLLLYDAIASLRSELEVDRVTMQTLASKLGVRCKTYRSELSNLPRNNSYIPNESLASAAYLLDSAKSLLRWLTSSPFLGKYDYDSISRNLAKHSFELALLSQRDSFADNAIEDVKYLCTKLIEICDYIVLECKDSLILQPAAVDVITIRKRQDQELGLQFEPNLCGVHLVSGVTLNSPAQQSGHLERGDEILQVNYQTVVAWSNHSFISLLEENPCEVMLTVKRRPRHACSVIGHMYLRPNRVPLRKVASPVLETEENVVVKPPKQTPASTCAAVVETNEESEETPSVSNNAETRFWKLYPRPKHLIKRRATVSGASPTSSRPPVTFVKDSSSATPRRHPLDKSKSESHKLDIDDQILRLFIGKSNIQGSRITLPLMENLAIDDHAMSARSRVEPIAEIKLPAAKPSEVSKSIPPDHPDKSLEDLARPPRPESPDILTHPVHSFHTDLGHLPPPYTSAPNLNSSLHSEEPIYTTYLHKRGQSKLGPRWTRYKATLYPKLLVVGTSEFKLGRSDYVIGLASEVHSRPFAFKLEELKTEKSTVYIAAESQLEMHMWMKLLSIETESLPHPISSQDTSLHSSSPPKVFRRSTSLQPGSPPFPSDKSLRRISLPQQNKPTRPKTFPRIVTSQMKSNSTSKLDEKRCLSATPTPTPYTKSNISSITITSLKRFDGGIVNDRTKIKIAKPEPHQTPTAVPQEPHSKSQKISNDETTRNSRQNTQDSGKLRMGIGMLNWKDTNHNACLSQCRTCGTRLNVKTTDSSTQTNDNMCIMFESGNQSDIL